MSFAVDMSCQSCVAAVRSSLEGVGGVSAFEADLESKTVTLESFASVEQLLAALRATGREARFIGQGSIAGARAPTQFACARLTFVYRL
jgi:copper chaperone CopZ